MDYVQYDNQSSIPTGYKCVQCLRITQDTANNEETGSKEQCSDGNVDS